MKKKITLNLFFLLLIVAMGGYGQKLPNVQETSLYAPANIKIDGKASEWNNKFQAYNKATDIYYAIANDDEMLYLTVQAKYQDIIDKILRGGLTFTISHTTNKNDKARISITYPVIRDMEAAAVANMLFKKSNEQRDANGADIPVDDFNKLFDAKSKLINITGIKSIPEESISVYNNDGIKTAAQLDNRIAYTYELAVPLKYLELPNNGSDKFSYQIKINPPPSAETRPTSGPRPPPAPPMSVTSTVATDFWGEYILAKK